MDQLFDEMKKGQVRTYSEMQQRKAELMNENQSPDCVIKVKNTNKLLPKIISIVLILFVWYLLLISLADLGCQ